jgi:hypothetical protein
VKLRSGQLAHLADDHVVLDGSDDASDDRRLQKTSSARFWRCDDDYARRTRGDAAAQERIGRLIPIDTEGVTPPQSTHDDHIETYENIQQNTTQH